MSPARRSVAAVALLGFLAGIGVGFGFCRWTQLESDGPPVDAASGYVQKMAQRYDLNRDQQRLVWMIVADQHREESQYLRRQVEVASLPSQYREEFLRIGQLANERILAVLDREQRVRFAADTADRNQPK